MKRPWRFHPFLLPNVLQLEMLPLEFLYRKAPHPAHVVLFPGAWNPPTLAHVAIAKAALRQADEVIWVMPRVLPHKNFEGPGFQARCRMMEAVVRQTPGFSAAVSEGGLYAEMAAEARENFGLDTKVAFALGRDAAERISGWDYGRPGVFEEFLGQHKLLVAARQGEYAPAARHAASISALPMEASWDEVSSSEVRRRIAGGEAWHNLVPQVIIPMVESLYMESR
ncbi:MAG: adenylyltransferase/cytidyltransferase family protein [Acidobacteriota bacterium]|nr:adenylyltransferase/cytidyltransferase family protein [Acidobacteriota bacterium]